MVNNTSIQSAFAGLVGWRQPLNPAYAVVDAANLLSSTGLYFQDASNLVRVEAIRDCLSYKDMSDAQFNTKLSEITKAALLKVMNNIFQDGDIIENNLLFNYESDFTHPIDNVPAFVGYEITVADSNTLSTMINSVKTSFDGVNTVKLLLFHTSKAQPIKTIDITTVANDEVNTIINWQLTHGENKAGGKYYIGYLTSDLTAKAYDRQYDSSNIMSSFNLSSFNSIMVNGWDAETLFDINNVENSSFSWGLNFDISGVKDYTSAILANKQLFVNAWMLQVSADCIDLIIHSDRINGNERNSYKNAEWELNGSYMNPDMPKIVGIIPRLNKEITKIKESFFKVQPITINTLK